jgi:hypothetical protein
MAPSIFLAREIAVPAAPQWRTLAVNVGPLCGAAAGERRPVGPRNYRGSSCGRPEYRFDSPKSPSVSRTQTQVDACGVWSQIMTTAIPSSTTRRSIPRRLAGGAIGGSRAGATGQPSLPAPMIEDLCWTPRRGRSPPSPRSSRSLVDRRSQSLRRRRGRPGPSAPSARARR